MRRESSTKLFQISLLSGYGNLDNQCKDPMNKNKDCRVGQLTKCAETFFTIDLFTSCYLLSHESNLDFKSIWKTTLQLEFIEHNNITAIAMG